MTWLTTYVMLTFWTWLLFEARQLSVPPEVLRSYEQVFQDQLRRLIQRTTNQTLRAKLEDMLDCPVRDRHGNCRSFAEYVYGALLKNGIHPTYDIEAALAYVVQKMLLDRSEVTGQPRASLFAGFTERPGDTPDFNPLQTRFMAFLQGAINNIRKGKVPRLSQVERRPQGTVSIGLGRRRAEDPGSDVSPDEIAHRPSADAGLAEMIDDIITLLRRKEQTTDIPLVALLQATMNGVRSEEERKQFGDRKARLGRQIIIQTIRDYAQATGNQALLRMLARLHGDEPTTTRRPRRPAAGPAKSRLPARERDYTSIIRVIERLGRPVGSADLGRFRRRWLQYAPRQKTPAYRNRLEEVLDMMVMDGVLRGVKTKQGALVYEPGPNYEPYRQLAGV